jgi:hypothetical protein
MPSWFIPLLVGVVAAGILVGLVVSFILFRSPQRESLFFRHRKSLPAHEADMTSAYQTGASIAGPLTRSPAVGFPQGRAGRFAPARDRFIRTETGPGSKKNAALLELENNLSIASQPEANHLVNFQTDIWNSQRGEFNIIDSAVLGELHEAYVDMVLANNIVWLVMELGHDSPALTESYVKLSSKIAERLQRALPSARASLK